MNHKLMCLWRRGAETVRKIIATRPPCFSVSPCLNYSTKETEDTNRKYFYFYSIVRKSLLLQDFEPLSQLLLCACVRFPLYFSRLSRIFQ